MTEEIARIDSSSAEEISEVWQLYQSSYGYEADLVGARFFPPMMRDTEELSKCGSQLFGLRRDGELIGAVEIYDEEEHQCDIYGLVVHPDQFRKGYGTRLLTYVVQRFHLKPLVSRAVYKNPRTTPLYTKFGFYDAGREFYSNGMQIVVWKLDPRI